MESGRRNSHFQIMIDLDSEDLTREQQIRNLTGRIKVCNRVFGPLFERNVFKSSTFGHLLNLTCSSLVLSATF